MKKRLSLLISVILALMLGITTSCATNNVNKLIYEYEMSYKVEKLSALTIDDYIEEDEIDDFGLTIVQTTKYGEDEELLLMAYGLFNVKTGAYIEGAVVEFTQEDMSVDTSTLLDVKMKGPIIKLADGMYAVPTIYGTRENVVEEFERTIVLELYGRNGKAGEVEYEYEGGSLLGDNIPFDEEDEILYDKDGTRYYVNVKGNLVKENNVLAKILTYDVYDNEDCEYLQDFILVRTEYSHSAYEVYDLDGNYVRNIDTLQKFRPTIDIYFSDIAAKWTIGNSLYIQYVRTLPSDAKQYDFISNNEDGNVCKYDLVTKRYDVEKDKAEDIDFNYVVYDDDEYSGGFDYVVLGVMAINKDKTLSLDGGLKAFDEKLNVYVDLHAIAPGAEYFEYYGEHLIIYTRSGDVVIVKGKKVVGTYSGNEKWSVDVTENSILVYDTEEYDTYKIYDIEGNLKKTYDNIEDMYWLYEDTIKLIIQTEGSIYHYDLATHKETVVATYTEDDYVYLDSFYVCITTLGEDGLAYTSDDVTTVNFYNEAFDDLVLGSEDYFDMVNLGNFYEETKNSGAYYSLYAVYLEDAEGNESVTYYRVTEAWTYEI